MADFKWPGALGRKLTLWRTEYKGDAYKDQMGMKQDGYLVLEEVEVEIVELKVVHGCWRHEDLYDGWKARAKDGREFFNQWDTFADDSMTPRYYWHEDDAGLEWVDSVQAAGHFVHVRQDGSRAIPAGGGVCDKHEYPVFYYMDEGCYRCSLEARFGKRK